MDTSQGLNDEGGQTILLESGRCSAEKSLRHTLEERYTQSTEAGLTPRALGMGAALGFILCPINIYFGLKVGRIAFLSIPVIILSKAFVPSLRKAEHFAMFIIAITAATISIPAGLIGVLPALEYLVLPEEGPLLQAGWGKLVSWSLVLCLPGPFLATALRERILIRGTLPFKIADTLAVQFESCHHESDTQAPDYRAGPEQDEGNPEQGLEDGQDTGRQIEGVKRLVVTLIVPILIAAVFVTTENCLLNVDIILPGVVGYGLIATPSVAVAMVLGAISRWGLLFGLKSTLTQLDTANDGRENNKAAWIVLLALAALVGDVLAQVIKIVCSRLGQMSERRVENTQSTIQADAGQPHSVDESSRLLSDNAAFRTDYGEGQAPFGPQGSISFNEPIWNVPRIVIALVLLFLALHCVLIWITTRDLMPWDASILSMVIAVVISLLSVQIMGQTSFNPVSALGKVSQFTFMFLYTGSLHRPVQTVLVVGAVTEAFACMAADMMLDYKMAQSLGVSPLAVLVAQLLGVLIGSGVGPFWYVTLMGRASEKPPFKMPSAELWIASARVAVERLTPKAILWLSAGIVVLFIFISFLRTSDARLWWLPDGSSFALGMYNELTMTFSWAIGGFVRWLMVRFTEGETKAMLWGSGLLLGDSMVRLIKDLVHILAAKGHIKPK